MTVCIRRPHSVWTTCRCEPCLIDDRRKKKLYDNGRYHRIPSAAAWAIIEEKRAAGWSSLAIASAADIVHGTIQNALTDLDQHGHRTHFGPSTSHRLVNMGDPLLGSVGATGSRRRLRGLARQGYDLEALAAITGVGFSTLAAIRGGTTTRVRASFYTTIRDHVTRIGDARGPSLLAPKHAERKGWESLAAWDNADDPDERPNTATAVDKHDIDHAVVERVLAGDMLPTTVAEKREITRRWEAQGRSLNELQRVTGWASHRYTDREAS